VKETRNEKFKRLATKRVNDILYRLDVLSNCSNKSSYEYSEEEINKIFRAIENKVKETKASFRVSKKEGFKL